MSAKVKMTARRRPRIAGKSKMIIRIESHETAVIEATGTIVYPSGTKRRIGSIVADRDSRRSKYFTVQGAYLDRQWRGKGYGYLLYWALAKEAKRLGFMGLRSPRACRNSYSESAWRKIESFRRNGFSYLNLD